MALSCVTGPMRVREPRDTSGTYDAHRRCAHSLGAPAGASAGAAMPRSVGFSAPPSVGHSAQGSVAVGSPSAQGAQAHPGGGGQGSTPGTP